MLIGDASVVETTHYVTCDDTDSFARFADQWKDTLGIAFPRLHGGHILTREPVGGSFRNPAVIGKRLAPASLADVELARICYNRDYPEYLIGQTEPAVNFDGEVSVDEMAGVDYASDGSGGRWLQAWAWLPGPDEVSDEDDD